jgi:hypothetical protein
MNLEKEGGGYGTKMGLSGPRKGRSKKREGESKGSLFLFLFPLTVTPHFLSHNEIFELTLPSIKT